MKEYWQEKKKYKPFFQMCLNNSSIKIFTLQCIRRFNIEVGANFSDIVITPYSTKSSMEWIDDLPTFFSEKGMDNRIGVVETSQNSDELYNRVYEGIKKPKKEISLNYPNKTIINFLNSPFSIICNLVECGSSKSFSIREKSKKIIRDIMKKIKIYLGNEIKQGIEVLKLFHLCFDILGQRGSYELVINPIQSIIKTLGYYKKAMIISVFSKNVRIKYKSFTEKVYADIIRIDHELLMKWNKSNLQHLTAIQSNLDNLSVTSCIEKLRYRVKKDLEVLSVGKFIFDFSHGILPTTKIKI